MPGQAFDGSTWVTAGQSVGLVAGTLACSTVGLALFARSLQRGIRIAPADLGSQGTTPGGKRTIQRISADDVDGLRTQAPVAIPEPVVARDGQPTSGEEAGRGNGP
eukprot:jgi/Botrbrau1/19155/Bobra.0077s0067.1